VIAMLLGEVAEAVGAKFVIADSNGSDPARRMVRRVITDSREVRDGDLFFAIRGQNHDGHGFLADAGARGAAACVADRAGAAGFEENVPAPILVVDDTVAALGRLAAHYRQAVLPVGATVIAITGSNGKTTTKGMIDHVLRRSLKGVASPKSYNNQIGVPLTMLLADEDDRYVVAELGTNNPGEIAALARLVSPHVGVITSIGEAHLEGLGGIAGVAAEKASLLEHIRPGGLAVVNTDRREVRPYVERCRHVRVVSVGTDPAAKLTVSGAESSLERTTFTLEGRYRIELPMPGAHHATNAAAAFAVARWLGVGCEQIIESLRTFVPAEGRTRRMEVDGVTIIDDAYNANPSSVLAAVEALRSGWSRRRIFVLGDMLELGPDTSGLHHRVVRSIVDSGIEVLVAVGEAVGGAVDGLADCGMEIHRCEGADAARRLLRGILREGDAVWVKGSRVMRLDGLVRGLCEDRPGVLSLARAPTAAVA